MTRSEHERALRKLDTIMAKLRNWADEYPQLDHGKTVYQSAWDISNRVYRPLSEYVINP